MPERERHQQTAETEILSGIHPVREAIAAGRRDIFEIYISKEKTSKRLQDVISLAESIRIPIIRLHPSSLQSTLRADHHQGIGARVSPYPFVQLLDILDNLRGGKRPPFLLLLDNVVDPHNLGALVRTAVCVGVDGICIPKDRSASPTPAVSKASAGALEHVLMAQVTNMSKTINMVKERGLWIVGLDKASGESIYSIDLTSPVSIVVGGEEKGIRPLVKKQCDMLVSIPQTGRIDSLNASVAGAVSMYEVCRQRIAVSKNIKSYKT